MSARLRRFTAGEVILSAQDAHSVLRFFSIEPGISPEKLTVEDRAFAQALLVEAIDASYEFGMAAALFNTLSMKPVASLAGLAFALAQFTLRAGAASFEHASAQDLKDPKIYESVRNVVRMNFASVWGIRLATGKLTY